MQLEEGAVVVPPGTAFVTYEEVKQSVGAKKVLKVFLVDREGRKHLAATGEDLGDAHYHYRTTKPFSKYGHIDCHNRKELTMWLEMVIAESGGKEGPHLDADEANPEGVYFTAYKYERAHMADGRRCNRWYLVDQHGASHLAVIGIERDTKDGHYAYTAEEPFASISPLNVSNQQSVFKWLENMVTHHAAGVDPQGQPALSNAAPSGGVAPSGSVNAPAADPSAVSAGGGGGGAADGGSGGNNSTGPGARKPPIIISLSAIRQARQQQSADAAAVHAAVPVDTAPESGGPRVKAPPAKPKLSPQQQLVAAVQAQVQQQQAQQQLHHQMPPLMPQHHAMHSGPKQKSVGIVQQNQIKKARKLQDDVRAEQERLITAHLTRLRRAAAAEVQSDSNAKQVTLAWLQGALTEDELEALEHWLHLLTAVLDMQEQRQQAAAAGGVPQDQKQQQRQDGGGGGDASSAAAADEAVGGFGDKDLLSWLRQPDNACHHLRVVMECLKELGAADIPAKVLLQHKVIGLVHRSLAQNDHEAVQAMGKRILQRWQWQLAGHMQVLSNPVYMEDHGAALEDEFACGLVPLPQLPKHKLALLNTPLPALPGAQHGGGGGGGGRSFYTPAGGGHSHIHQQQQQHAPGSAPAALDPIAAAAAAAAAAGLGRFGAAGFGQGLPVGSAAFPGLPGFYTPLVPASAALLRAASPGALGGLMQPTLLFGQPGSGNQAQQLALMGQMQQQQHHHLLPESGGVTGWPMAAAGVAAAAAQDASGGLPYGGGLAAGSSSDLAALAADATSVQQQQQAQVQAQAHQQQQLALLASWQQHQHQQNLAALLMLQQQTSAAAVAAASAPMLMNMPTSAPAEGQMPQHQQLLLQQHQQLVQWQQQQNHQQPNQQQQEPQPMQH